MLQSDLQKMKRAELQKLAKANNVKANLKTGDIIDQLLQRFAAPVPSSSRAPSAHPPVVAPQSGSAPGPASHQLRPVKETSAGPSHSRAVPSTPLSSRREVAGQPKPSHKRRWIGDDDEDHPQLLSTRKRSTKTTQPAWTSTTVARPSARRSVHQVVSSASRAPYALDNSILSTDPVNLSPFIARTSSSPPPHRVGPTVAPSSLPPSSPLPDDLDDLDGQSLHEDVVPAPAASEPAPTPLVPAPAPPAPAPAPPAPAPAAPIPGARIPSSPMPGEERVAPEVCIQVIAKMQDISRVQNERLTTAEDCEQRADGLVGAVRTIRARIRQEGANCRRLLGFIGYWNNIEPRWKDAEIWNRAAPTRIDEDGHEVEITSDDEVQEPRLPPGAKPTELLPRRIGRLDSDDEEAVRVSQVLNPNVQKKPAEVAPEEALGQKRRQTPLLDLAAMQRPAKRRRKARRDDNMSETSPLAGYGKTPGLGAIAEDEEM
ncbi:hypothetical protein BD413DRAFT_610969 [Trametes elegans]|nr:hypothetical protein BD413DRAFT_610969 [Trametes elegans]